MLAQDKATEAFDNGNLFVSEAYVNRDEGSRFGNSEPYEPWTDDLGRLFRDYRAEFGRCTGKVYRDDQDGQPIQVGWVFEKRTRYQDCEDTYLQETWVEVMIKVADPVPAQYDHPWR